MRVPLRLERSAALFVSMHFASFGGQGSKVLVGCRHVSMAHSILYHFKGHLALTLTYVGYPYRGGGTGPSVCGHVHNHIKPLALPYETTRGQDRRRRRRRAAATVRYRSAKSPRTIQPRENPRHTRRKLKNPGPWVFGMGMGIPGLSWFRVGECSFIPNAARTRSETSARHARPRMVIALANPA